LKNPLASLASAVETLGRVDNPALHAQLLEVVRSDVARIDRLITDIAEASRLDAELARSRFERVDLGLLTANIVDSCDREGGHRDVEIAFAAPDPGSVVVIGAAARLAQVVRNVLDNALSFSPPGGVVVIVVTGGERVILRIDDDGPGIPPENRDDIFRRFYSERPASEAFGRHSGLGLAIARTIVEAHDGTIVASNREVQGRVAGARFVVSLPGA